jgi:peptidoglycan hydrolase-like protein with peptidoglycan-binding domain
MGIVTDRLMFLGVAGLTVAVVYNALYLQDEKRDAARGRGDAAEIALGGDGRAAPGAASGIMRAIQRELTARGFDPGPADGLAGEKTRQAILAYQKQSGMEETGQPSAELLRQIVLGVSIAELPQEEPPKAATETPPRADATADRVDELAALAEDPPQPQTEKPQGDKLVEAVQGVLADLGYAPGPVDGVMGEATRKAISAFERDRNLPPKGEVTPSLIREIERVSGRALSRQG